MKSIMRKNIKMLWIFLILILWIQSYIFLPTKVFAEGSQIRITEIMFDPTGNGDKEFLEIYNGSDTSVVLGGMTLFGVDYTFSAGSTLSAGQYGVIVRNQAVFTANNPNVKVFGQYGGKLRGSGELISVSKNGVIQTSVSYSFGGAWPSSPKNGGPSLSLVRTDANEKQSNCWSASNVNGGSPGKVNHTSGGGSGCGSVAYPQTVSSVQSGASNNSQSSSSQTAHSTNNNIAPSSLESDRQTASSQDPPNSDSITQEQLQKQAIEEAKIAEQASAQIAENSIANRQKTKSDSILALGILILISIVAVSYFVYQQIHNHMLFVRLNKKPLKKSNVKKK